MSIDPEVVGAGLRRLARGEPGSDIVQTLTDITHACVDIFGVSGSGIMIADEQDLPRDVAASDPEGRILERAETQTRQGPCTQAFVTGLLVDSRDLQADRRWPELAALLEGHPVRAVIGVPVRLGGAPVGTLDLYRSDIHEWDDSERTAVQRFAEVVESTLAAAMAAHAAGELARQLQYALDYRVVIERAIGFLMAVERVDAVQAFDRLRQAARSSRRKIGAVAEDLLRTGRLPASR
ncbi:MAG TPA: GAF and ANTAR domain-containing protein [Microlunatus sp.]|nr:GAF and ANTAR domain-containing protein [Microlunatus sp.]